MAEHGIGLFQLQHTLANLLKGHAGCFRYLPDLLLAPRQELMQRRIEQTDGDRQALHDREDLDEVLLLHRLQLFERGASPGLVLCDDHLTHGDDTVRIEEHMLRTAEADSLAAEFDRGAAIERSFGVGPDLQAP